MRGPVGRLDRPRPPVAAVATGVVAGLLAVAALPLLRGYVGGVLALVGGGEVRPGNPGLLVSLGAAALVGLSMNFLPCNLPIVLSLLPATAAEESRGAFLSRTALYALGAVAVLGTVGALLGLLGDRVAPLVRSYPAAGPFVALAVGGGVGLLSVAWGLREFEVVDLPSAPLSVTDSLRSTVDGRDDAAGYVLLGAVYGGTGGGCPLPTYHLLLLWAVVAASPLYGAALLGTYVLGRIAPVALLGAVFRERPGRVADLFGGKYGRLRTVNGVVLVGGGSLLLTFTAVRVLMEVA